MTTDLQLPANIIKISKQRPSISPAAATPSFIDYDLELKYCWFNNKDRDWSVYNSTDTGSYYWDTRASKIQEKDKK